jgi:integrase
MRPRKKDRHLPPCVYLKHGAYWLVRGGKWEKLGRDLPSALQAYGKAYARPQGAMPALIRAGLEAHRKTKKLATATWDQYQVAARKLIDILAEFSPEQVTQRDLIQIKLALADTPNMANRCITVLRIVFDYALDIQIIANNPAVGVKRFREHKRDRLISDAEFTAVRSVAPPRLAILLDLMYLTGQRVVDVLRIRRTDIRDEGIYFRQQKTDEQLVVGWTPELHEAVERAKSLYGNVKAFTLLHGRTGKAPDYRTTKDQWDKACKATGVSNAQLRDLRAMSGTAADDQGLNATKLLGHKSETMTQRYLRNRRAKVVQGPSFRQVSKKAS